MALQGFVLDGVLTNRLEKVAGVARDFFALDATITSGARRSVAAQKAPPRAKGDKRSANGCALSVQLCWHRYRARKLHVALLEKTYECKVDNARHLFFYRHRRYNTISYRLPMGIGERELQDKVTLGQKQERLKRERKEQDKKEKDAEERKRREELRKQREEVMLVKLKGAELEALNLERKEREVLARTAYAKAQAKRLFEAIDENKDGELDDVECEMFVRVQLLPPYLVPAMNEGELAEAMSPVGRAPSGGVKYKQWQSFYCLPPEIDHGDEPHGPATRRLLKALEAWAAADLGQQIIGLHR
jgi:hypothetical protein